MVVDDNLIPLLEEMLYELMENRLVVCVVPGNDGNVNDDGRKVRAVTSQNVEWYQELCLAYPSTRIRKNLSPDTKIRRKNVVRVLERLIATGKSLSMYAGDLIAVATDRHKLYELLAVSDTEQELLGLDPWDNQF